MALEIKHLTIKVQVSYQSDMKQARQRGGSGAPDVVMRANRQEIVRECLREIRSQAPERSLDR